MEPKANADQKEKLAIGFRGFPGSHAVDTDANVAIVANIAIVAKKLKMDQLT